MASGEPTFLCRRHARPTGGWFVRLRKTVLMRIHWRKVVLYRLVLFCFTLLALPGSLLGQEGATVAATVAAPKSTKWAKEMLAFEAQAVLHPPELGGVLFVGSSSIRLWKLEESFPELSATNRGFGGSEMIDSVYYFDRLVLPSQPRLVVLYAGDNDIANQTSPAAVHAYFQQFVAKLHAALPETRLVYVPIKPSIKRWSLIEQGRAANALIRATCEQDDKLVFLEIEKSMLGADQQPRPELFVEDGLHLSPEGYALWSALLKPHLVP